MTGISYIDNVSIPELANYSASISISAATVNGINGYIAKVTVTPPYGNDVVLETFRTMYAPGSP